MNDQADDRTSPFAEGEAEMARQIGDLLARPDTLFLQAPPDGFLRGIDFYSIARLIRVAELGAHRYRTVHGTYPSLSNPVRLNEKLFWAKIFRPMKFPETGNKLETANLVPDEARGMAAIPEIVWRSPNAELPSSDSIEPGTYYLKSNHGSDMFRRIDWPVSTSACAALEQEFAGYLARDYGYWNGEWWYHAFPREIFIERSISSDPNPIAWYCYMFGGKVGLITAYRKVDEETHTIWLNSDFKPLERQHENKPRTQPASLPESLRRKMLDAAIAIGSHFCFVRVDFLTGDDEQLYLSELTFNPGNAMTPWPAELDVRLGAMWDLGPLQARR